MIDAIHCSMSAIIIVVLKQLIKDLTSGNFLLSSIDFFHSLFSLFAYTLADSVSSILPKYSTFISFLPEKL